jgi:hypothetical protein
MREINDAGRNEKEETGNGSLLNGFNNSCKTLLHSPWFFSWGIRYNKDKASILRSISAKRYHYYLLT